MPLEIADEWDHLDDEERKQPHQAVDQVIASVKAGRTVDGDEVIRQGAASTGDIGKGEPGYTKPLATPMPPRYVPARRSGRGPKPTAEKHPRNLIRFAPA